MFSSRQNKLEKAVRCGVCIIVALVGGSASAKTDGGSALRDALRGDVDEETFKGTEIIAQVSKKRFAEVAALFSLFESRAPTLKLGRRLAGMAVPLVQYAPVLETAADLLVDLRRGDQGQRFRERVVMLPYRSLRLEEIGLRNSQLQMLTPVGAIVAGSIEGHTGKVLGPHEVELLRVFGKPAFASWKRADLMGSKAFKHDFSARFYKAMVRHLPTYLNWHAVEDYLPDDIQASGIRIVSQDTARRFGLRFAGHSSFLKDRFERQLAQDLSRDGWEMVALGDEGLRKQLFVPETAPVADFVRFHPKRGLVEIIDAKINLWGERAAERLLHARRQIESTLCYLEAIYGPIPSKHVAVSVATTSRGSYTRDSDTGQKKKRSYFPKERDKKRKKQRIRRRGQPERRMTHRVRRDCVIQVRDDGRWQSLNVHRTLPVTLRVYK